MTPNPRNKKRERNAPLFKTCVAVNTKGNLIIDHEWVNPEKLIAALSGYKDDHYKHIFVAIINHCMSESLGFDEKLNKLLRQM